MLKQRHGNKVLSRRITKHWSLRPRKIRLSSATLRTARLSIVLLVECTRSTKISRCFCEFKPKELRLWTIHRDTNTFMTPFCRWLMNFRKDKYLKCCFKFGNAVLRSEAVHCLCPWNNLIHLHLEVVLHPQNPVGLFKANSQVSEILHIEVWGYLKHMCRCLHCKAQEQVCAHPI